MHERTKKTSIPTDVKRRVWSRDHERCIFCRRWVTWHNACAHVVNRSQGGLGVDENIITACPICHNEMDNGKDSASYRNAAIRYMQELYEGWTRESVTFKKGENNERKYGKSYRISKRDV